MNDRGGFGQIFFAKKDNEEKDNFAMKLIVGKK